MTPVVLGQLIAFLLFGAATGLLAKRKGRNPWLWGVFGGLTFLVALLVLAFMPYACKSCGAKLTNKQGKGSNCPTCSRTNEYDMLPRAIP